MTPHHPIQHHFRLGPIVLKSGHHLETVFEAFDESATAVDELAAGDCKELQALKANSDSIFSLRTRKNLASWKLDSVKRDIEDTERFIRKLRLDLGRIHPSDDSEVALARLDYYTAELVEQRQELKELSIKRRALDSIIEDLCVQEKTLDQQFYALTVDPD